MAEPLDATFFAFRRREKQGVLTGATLAYLAAALILAALVAVLFWSQIVALAGWYGEVIALIARDPTHADAPPPPPFGAMFAIGPAYLLWLILHGVLHAAWEAACMRWMIRGESGAGVLGLDLGADTWRVFLCYIVWLALAIGFYIAVLLVVGVGVALVVAVAGDGSGAAAGAGVAMFVPLLVFAALIYFLVRFAPATAATVAERRFAFFDAWAVTRGRFWALFGAFVLLGLIMCVAVIVLETVGFATLFALAGASLADLFTADDPHQEIERVFAAFLTPPVLAAAAVLWAGFVAVGMVFRVAFFGVSARAAAAAIDEGKISAGAPPAAAPAITS